ncbi:MAG: hypothetical protein AAF708_15055 [Deinococcota bacterium]
MPAAYKVLTVSDVDQTEQDMSFKGGIPNISDRFEVPCCSYCEMPMTFFFQVAFPKGHIWDKWVMAFFYCTSWEHDKGRYEEYVDTIYVPDQIRFLNDFLATYQKNFRVYVFEQSETTNLQPQVPQLFEFERFEFEPVDASASYEQTTKVGGIPDWEWGDATHNDIYKNITYMDGGVDFLMKLERDCMFMRLPDAPLRHEYLYVDKYDINNPHVSNYNVFFGHPLFFFGSNSPRVNPPQVLLYLG